MPFIGRPTVNMQWCALLIAALLAIPAFHVALSELVRRWSTQQEYSHGFLIPLIAGWFLWRRRDELRASLSQPAWIGTVLCLVALLIHIVGQLSAIFVLSQASFVLMLMGIVSGLGGISLLRVVFVPLAFLVFAIPLPYFVDASLSLQLQLISSRLGVFVIRLFEIPVYLDGNIVDLGIYKLQVVDACSGLRYLFPLLSLSFLAAYILRAPLWQRALVLFSSIPITIAMNGFRIGIVGVTVERWGPQMADGVLHFFEGWIIFVVSALLLAVELWLLARMSGRDFSAVFAETCRELPGAGQPDKQAGHHAPLYVCLLLICATVVTSSMIPNRIEAIPERSRFVTFPSNIGDWRGHASLLEPAVEHSLTMDDYVLSDYSHPDDKTVNLYIAYYRSQRTGESPHSPLVCIPGSGWSITTFQRTSDAEGNPLNRAIIEQGGSRQLVYYWYEERGRRLASEWSSKWYLVYDTITKNRSDGALVRLITPIFPGERERDTDQRLQQFISDLQPLLTSYLPGSDPSHFTQAQRAVSARNR